MISTVRPSQRQPVPGRSQARHNGVMTIMPAVSPSHQIKATLRSAATGTTWASHRLETPMLAPISATPAATAAKAYTVVGRSRAGAGPAIRRSNQAPASASSVLPAAMTADTVTAVTPLSAPLSVNSTRLATRAPASTPGQRPGPSSNRAARARPDGGHTGDALVWAKASARPSRAAA